MNRLLKNMVYHTPWLFSDRKFLELSYELHTGKKLDLDNPETFNEKIQWLKLYDRRSLCTTLADKAAAKQWAAGVIGQEHIIPTIAVYDSVKQIDWDSLPEEFVLKCTHDSGGMVLCRSKNALDRDKATKKLAKALRSDFWFRQREWAYKGIPHRIIAEPLMKDSRQRRSLTDYKYFCFDGKAEFMYISEGLNDHSTASVTFTDLEGNALPFCRADYATHKALPPMPQNRSLMQELAERLAKASGSAFVRVDMYEIDGQVYFSEMTFYPNSGFIPFTPQEWDNKLGGMLHLPAKTE